MARVTCFGSSSQPSQTHFADRQTRAPGLEIDLAIGRGPHGGDQRSAAEIAVRAPTRPPRLGHVGFCRSLHADWIRTIDASAQISLFVKLKLQNCARPGDCAGLLILGAWPVAWVELIRAFTPVFAGYAKPTAVRFSGLGVSTEAQLVGYGAIGAARCGEALPAPKTHPTVAGAARRMHGSGATAGGSDCNFFCI